MITSQMFTVKGSTPWYSVWWVDDHRVVGRVKRSHDGTTITCDGDVTNMQSMFALCRNLTSIDLSNFDTSKVFHMGHMFADCNDLTELNLSGVDTSKVSDMRWMFNDCYELPTLDLSGFDTSNVECMHCMFWGCANLTTIKGVIDMKSCTDCAYMFKDCYKLSGVKIKNPPAGFNGEGLNPSQYTIVS